MNNGVASVLLAALVLMACGVNGFDPELQLSIHDVSSTIGGGHDRQAQYTLNNLGLNGLTHSNSPTGTMWLSAPNQHLNAFIVYLLSGTPSLTGLRIWNYNEGAPHPSRGAKDVEIQTSMDGTTFTTVHTFVLPEAPGTSNTNFNYDINLGQEYPARYVKILCKNNHNGDAYTGLSEVKMYGKGPSKIALPMLHSYSSQLSNIGRQPQYAIRDRGLSGNTHTASVSDMWLSAYGDTTPWITFDLRKVYGLRIIRIWNYNEGSHYPSRGFKSTKIHTSPNGLDWTLAGTYTIPKAPGQPFSNYYEIDLLLDARFVRLEAVTNWGDTGYTGLSEVQFWGTASPGFAEPSANTLMTGVGVHDFSSSLASSTRNPGFTIHGLGMLTCFGQLRCHSTYTGEEWLAALDDTTPWITYDLFRTRRVDWVRVLNYQEQAPWNHRGYKRIEISTSTDGQTWTTRVANGAMPEAPIQDGEQYGEDFDLGGVDARYVKLKALENHGDTYTGLAEVIFFGEELGPVGGEVTLAVSSVSSEIGGAHDRKAVYTIGGRGLTGNSHNTNVGDMWLSAINDPAAWIAYDLGSIKRVDLVRVWNYNEGAPYPRRSMRLVSIEVSLDNVTFTPISDYGMLEAPGTAGAFFEDFRFYHNARYVKIRAKNPIPNYDDPNGYTGLSEVKVFASAAVVTPAPPPTPSPDLCLGACLMGRCTEGQVFTTTVVLTDNGQVWGSGPFTEDSDLSTAARHAGLGNVGETTSVTVRCTGTLSSFSGSTSNSVTTTPYSSPWASFSFDLNGVTPQPSQPAPELCTAEPCALNKCTVQGTSFNIIVVGSLSSNVWGHRTYSDDSNLGTAAVHMGLAQNGERASLNVMCTGAQSSFEGKVQNGVASQSFGFWQFSYQLSAGVPLPPPPPAGQCAEDCLRDCPSGTALTLRVTGTAFGYAWGSGPFTSDTSVGVAAVHSGLLSAGASSVLAVACGGTQSSYTGTTQNGVTSLSFGEWGGSFTLATAPAASPTLCTGSCVHNVCRAIGQVLYFTVTGRTSQPVWGSSLFSDDSDVPTAAVHAGLVADSQTTTVVAVCRGPQTSFEPSQANGVSSGVFGSWPASFHLEAFTP